MSSLGESSHIDGITSEQPMLNSGIANEKPSTTNNTKIKLFAKKRQCRWVVFIGVTILVLAALVIGAIVLLVRAHNIQAIYKPETEIDIPETGSVKQVKKTREFVFEYKVGEEREEKVIINVKDNYTELFAEDVKVFNHFRKGISLHRLEISPGIQICLVKLIEREVQPGELQEALSAITDIPVNSTELYMIENNSIPEEVNSDITVLQLCDESPIYLLKKVDPLGPDVGMTMEELLEQFSEDYMFTERYRRDINPGPAYCGSQLPAMEFTCTKKNSYCYKSLVNERCQECYHGHGVRTSGCWCPIEAIETCIRITYKPVKRFCCGVDRSPCVRSECETKRVPFVPVPIITVKIINHNDKSSR